MSEIRQRGKGKEGDGSSSTPAKASAGAAKGSNASKPAKTGKKASALTHLVLPFLAIAPIFFAMLSLSRTYCTVWFESNHERPCFITLPYVGGSIMPFVFGLFIFIFRRRFLNFLPRFLQGFLCFAPLFLLFLHNFFTVFYGNINNDAWSHSLMIDIVAPPQTLKTFTQFVPELHPSYNTAAWAHETIIDGPHLDIQGVHDAKCGERGFARFMYHRIDPRARVHAILGQGVMFGGIWVMAEGDEGIRASRPKVFTDFAYGNDDVFNHLMRWLLVDEYNWYSKYIFSDDFVNGWSIRSGTIAPYNNESVLIHTTVDGLLPAKQFVMDQYSCMSESNWLYKVVKSGWCFYKKMDAQETYAIRGTMDHPLLAEGGISFPQGNASDCSRPYVRAVLTKYLHWVRPTYEC